MTTIDTIMALADEYRNAVMFPKQKREELRTAIERELDELVEAARLLGGAQAKRGFGCHTDEDSRFERAMYESIDKYRAALLRLAEEHGNEH